MIKLYLPVFLQDCKHTPSPELFIDANELYCHWCHAATRLQKLPFINNQIINNNYPLPA